MERKTPAQERLAPLLFELLRLIKREVAFEELPVHSWLHLETLRYISEGSEPSMREVADYLRVKAPTATVFIATLVEDGLVERRTDPKDRRRVTLAITAKGKSCIKQAAVKREHAFERVVAPLSAGDRSEFARLLSIITHRAS